MLKHIYMFHFFIFLFLNDRFHAQKVSLLLYKINKVEWSEAPREIPFELNLKYESFASKLTKTCHFFVLYRFKTEHLNIFLSYQIHSPYKKTNFQTRNPFFEEIHVQFFFYETDNFC